MTREQIDFFVLDTLSNDIEALENVLDMLNSATEMGWRDQHDGPFTRQEVIPALLRGVREGNIEICVYSEEQKALVDVGEHVIPAMPLETVWFRLTDRGKVVLDNWEPPPLPDEQD